MQRLGQPYGAEEVVDAVLGLHTKVAQLYQNFKSLLGTAAEFQTANEGTSSWRNVSRRMQVSVSPGLTLRCAEWSAVRSWRTAQEPGGCWLRMHWCGLPCHCQATLSGVDWCRRAGCSLPDKASCGMQPLSLSPVAGLNQ